ncbi:MAG: tetratricopeptide repeat protein [candidate division WOR-3 bacterium]
MAQRRPPTADRRPLTTTILPALAVVLTFAIRLWFILEMRGHPFSVISAQVIDSWYYHTWALDIVHKSLWGNEVFFLRPLYPYMLAGLYAIFGPKVFPVQLFQCFLAAVSCFLLYDSTRRIFGRTSALFAAFGFALTGIIVFYTGALLYVEVTVFFSLLTLWLVLWSVTSPSPLASPFKKEGKEGKGQKPPSPSPSPLKGEGMKGRGSWRWAIAGISFGLLVICRPEMLILLPAFVIVLWRTLGAGRRVQTAQRTAPQLEVRSNASPPSPSSSPFKGEGTKGRGAPTRLRAIITMTACALATIAVVPIRNLIVAREPVLFTAHSGINFYYGWNPWTDGTWQQTELERTAGFSHQQLKRISRMIDGRELSWSQASAYWTRKGLEFVVRTPGRSLWLLSRKFLLFWSNYEVPSNYYPETAWPYSVALKVAFLNFGLIAALGLVGVFLALSRNGSRVQGFQGSSAGPHPSVPLALYPLFFILAFLVSSLVFYVLSRLRAPVIPFFLMFAGYAVAETVSAIRQGKWMRSAVISAAAIILYAGSGLIPVDRRTYTAQAWTQAGNTYMTMGSSRAFDAFRRAIDANPANPVARYGLFVAYAGLGRTKEAEAEYRELAKVVGTDPRNRVLAELAGGRLAIARRDFALAIRHYKAAVELDPLNAENYYLLGLVYVSMDSLEPARAALSQAIRIDPNHDAARSSLEKVEAHLAPRQQL